MPSIAEPCDLRPGSSAKIELMRQRVAAQLPTTHPLDATFAEAIFGREQPLMEPASLKPICIEPLRTPAPERIRTMSERLIDAIAAITESGDEAAKQIDRQIGEYETKIAKLKKLRKLVTAPAQRTAIDPAELERRIIESIRSHGAAKPGVIAERVGAAAVSIGVCVRKSKKLSKNAAGEIVAK